MRLARIRLTNSSVAFAVLIAAGLTLSVAVRSRIARASSNREAQGSTESVLLTMRAHTPLTPAGATYTWIGGTPVVTTDWTVATNWSQQGSGLPRTTPAATDNLVFDGSGTPSPTITNIPTQTIATLSFTNGVLATFNAASGGATLTVSGATGSDLSIPNVTSLALAGSNALTISLSSGSKGLVGGQITLQDAAHRFTAGDVNGITFQSGSIFTTSSGFSGNPFGAGTDGSVIFQSSSSAFFNAGSDPFGGSGHSVATFNLGSSQTFNTSSAFSSDGRTYGNLALDGSQSYSGSGSGLLTIFNTLTIVSGSTLTLSSSAGGDLNMLLGNLTISGTLNTNGRAVKFQGGGIFGGDTQIISCTMDCTIATFDDLVILKAAGSVKLGGTVTINGALQFDGTGSAVDVLEFNQNNLNLNGTVGGTSSSASNGFKGDATGATLNITGMGALGTLKFVSGSQSLKSLTVNRTSSGTATLGSPLAVANTLTLTSGIVTTTSSNLLTVINTAANAISGGASSSYINGPLARALPASLGTGSTYSFPVGKGTFNPFEMVNPTTNVSATIQAEVFDANSGGTAGSGLTSLNTNRYWSATVTAGSFTSTVVQLTDSSVSSSSRIGKSSTVNGIYNSIGGTVSGLTISSNLITGTLITSPSFFNIGAISCPMSITVNDNGDTSDASPGEGICADANGKCTLRAAIQEASADTSCGGAIDVNFSISTPNTIVLGGALPAIGHNVNINGPGASLLTVQRNSSFVTPNFGIFTIQTGRSVTISGLKLSGGNSSSQGGAIFNSGTLTLTDGTLSGNVSKFSGGGIYNQGGIVTLINSTVSGNSGNSGGGIFNSGGTVTLTNTTVNANTTSGNGAGIFNIGTLTLANSTLNGNVANGNGGAILSSVGPLTLTNCTASGNTAGSGGTGSGGGIFRNSGTASISNTIIAGNTGITSPDVAGSFTSDGYNLIGKSDGSSGFSDGVNGDVVGTIASPINPLLGPLANNGGATQTIALLPGSPAINAGSNANLRPDTFDLDGDADTAEPLPVDQRGVGFARIVNTTVDIGAFESRGFTIASTSGSSQSATITTLFSAPLVATVTSASGEPVAGGVVTFNAPVSGPSGTFAGGVLSATITTNTSGVATSPFTANAVAGIYNITASANGISGTAQFGLTNAPAATSTSVSSSVNPSDVGQTVLFTATVTATAGTPTGAVQFMDGANSLGSASCFVSSANTCVAQLSTSSLSAGTHVITANYSDANGNFSSSSGNLSGGQLVGSIIKFDLASYSVNEADGSVTIKVNRTGAISGVVTVAYATNDAGASIDCAPVNNLASSRCDFTSAFGTLIFNSAETQKSINVLVNRDSYSEGPEAFTMALSNLTGAAIFASPTATMITINDSPAIGSNAIDDSTNFVRQHYHDFLNREPDASGLQFWTNEIESCGTDTTCREVKRINVSGAFYLSIEFQQTGYLVERLYKASFGDADGTSKLTGAPQNIKVPIVRLNEFLSDTQEIGQGVIVNQGNWQQQLEINKNAFAAEFVQRSRFASMYPTTMRPRDFVARLFINTGVLPTFADEQAAINEFGTATDTADLAARGRALRKIAENTTFNQAEFNRAFVLMQYFGYLRRNPNDAPEPGLDYSGFDFWLTKLNQFGGNFQNAEMVKAFISSDEYRHRFGL